MADPTPVLSQIIANQEAFSNTLDTNFQTIGTATESLLSQGLPQAFQAFESSIQADSVQSVINAYDAGDTTTALTDLINLPAIVTGAFLNGSAATDGVDYVGILSSAASPSGGGPLDALLVQIPREIAQALGASASGSAAASLGDLVNLIDPSAFGDAGSNLLTELLASI